MIENVYFEIIFCCFILIIKYIEICCDDNVNKKDVFLILGVIGILGVVIGILIGGFFLKRF